VGFDELPQPAIASATLRRAAVVSRRIRLFYAAACFGTVSLHELVGGLIVGAGETALKHRGATFTTRSYGCGCL
jgi:hypothetical protein